MLVVTFTRLATGELRERVRARLVEARDVLEAHAAGAPVDATDPWTARLVEGGDAAVRTRRARIGAALSGFDAAAVETTHGFCQRVLDGLGVAGDAPRGVEVTDDLDGVVADVVDDMFLRGRGSPGGLPFGVTAAATIGRLAAYHPDAPVVPPDDPDPGVAARVRFAQACRAEFDRRKRAMGLMGFDDLQGRLADTLGDPEAGDACRRALESRFDVVLIDEFQDTDPVQWRIISQGLSGATVVLIGDPKQAIYAFRGADVHTYLHARGHAHTHFTLPVNWRSDGPFLRALEALLGGARLGDEGIAVGPVKPAPGRHGTALEGAGPALRVRVVRRDRTGAGLTLQGHATADWARREVCDDLARQVAALVSGSVRIGTRSVRPSDIGVLTRTNGQAVMVRDALAAADVPAVIAGTGSVFATPEAVDWARLLAALERPADHAAAAAAALTPFVGWDARRLAECPEDDREELHELLHGWRDVMTGNGVAALLRTITRDRGMYARVLALPGGERRLTDLRHVGQLLHQAAVDEGLGPAALAGWLADMRSVAENDQSEERSRLLESDGEAVRVLTVHRSKGLEFPIVCAPFLWEQGLTPKRESVFVVHDPADGRRVLDVGGSAGAGAAARLRAAVAEARGEELRLAYVALTRACHQAIVWWAGYRDARRGPLTRLAADRGADGAVPDDAGPVPRDDDMMARLRAIAEASPGCVSVEAAEDAAPPGEPPSAGTGSGPLDAARFGRDIDRDWGRHSYSRITEGAYEALVASEPETPHTVDEPDPAAEDPGEPLPMDDLPAGTAFGSRVHGILEVTDFAAGDLAGELDRAARAQPGDQDATERAVLTGWLAQAILTPLGPALGEARLRDVTPADRLNELDFEMPLTGGERPRGTLRASHLADLLDAHLPAGDPLATYPDALRALGAEGLLRGFMVGSLDLVVRLPGPRFAVIDHKTNLLGTGGRPRVADYHPDALAVQMQSHHYVLQALIYQVVLHRYLRWRLPGYDPGRHLAGAHYLFLRGLSGAATRAAADGRRHGVFSWTPASALVTAADALFHRGGAT